MDLIYMDESKKDINTLKDYTLDLAFGFDENDFALSVDTSNHVCKAGYGIYIEGTEYGGIITSIRVNTAQDELIYKGDTWHGILAKKIIQPDAGEDYYVCNGEANIVIGEILSRVGLGDLFKASNESSGMVIKNYKMNRYINAYDGIKKMLGTVNGKLNFTFIDGFVVLSANPIIDYSHDDEFDSSQIDFDVEKHYKHLNHVICLGKGELKDREVIHVYADASGNISMEQSLFGLDEEMAVYENVNVESSEELLQGGIDLLKESWNADELQVDFDSNRNYDIGDIVGARENITGIFVARPILKKIVTITNDVITVQHKVGE